MMKKKDPMDLEVRQNDEKVMINANCIISKYRNKNDRLLFCHEKNWWHPDEVGFDSTYFLNVLSGKKKYLPGNFAVKYKIGYFKNGTKLDKKFIISKMNGNALYGDYVPDNCDPMKLSREFLLTLVAYVDPTLYNSFYEIYKNELNKRQYNKWSEYNIEIKRDIINDINNFMPVNLNTKSSGGFRLNKNHQSTNVFYKNIAPNQINNNIQNMNEGPIINKLIDIEGKNRPIQARKTINIELNKK